MARLVAVLATLALILSLGNSAAAANPKGDVAKAVFVHYKDNLNANAKPAGKGGACPDPTTCRDYRWGGYKWSASTVTYVLDTNSIANAATAVQEAFAAWTRPVNVGATRLTVTRSGGSADCATAGGDINYKNQICWADLNNSGIIAVTNIWYYTISKEIIDADVTFNTGPGFSWSYYDAGACDTFGSCNDNLGSSTSYDVRNIATHEFGHFLAFLGDLYNAKDADLTMYGYGGKGETEKDSLGKGDCLGITKAYGGSCQ